MVNLYLEEFMPNVEFKPLDALLYFGFWVLVKLFISPHLYAKCSMNA